MSWTSQTTDVFIVPTIKYYIIKLFREEIITGIIFRSVHFLQPAGLHGVIYIRVILLAVEWYMLWRKPLLESFKKLLLCLFTSLWDMKMCFVRIF